jgi:hypothetical protein
MPVPRRNGGTDTVPCCKTCHEAKDNIPLRDWPVEMWANIFNDFPKLSRDTRLFLGKTIACFTDACSDLERKERFLNTKA